VSEEGLLLGRILLVDDDPQLRRLVARDLEEAGHTCLVAADPAEARRFLRTEQVELMLCDVHMPGESGMTLLREVIAQHADVGTVMISGVDDPRFAETALGLGALGYLVKPVTPTELLIGVSNALRRLREQRGEKESAVQLAQAAQNLGAELEAERGRIERLQEETRSSEGQIAELQARIAALEERQRLIERLSEAQRELLAAGSPEALLDAVLAGAELLSGQQVIQLRLIDPEDSSFTFVAAARGLDGKGGGALPVDEPPASAFAAAGVDQVLSLPLVQDDSVVGSLNVASPELNGSSRQAVELLEEFAGHAATRLAAAGLVGKLPEVFEDDLTGLPTRARLLQKLDQAIQGADPLEAPVALVATTLDIKPASANVLPEGDLDLLRVEFSRRLRATVDDVNPVARASGNEFLILLTDSISRADPIAVAETVVRIGKEPFELGARKLTATVSAGVSYGASRPNELLRDAEIALFQARRRGGGRHEKHSPGLRATLRSVQPLEAELIDAVDRGEFSVLYEPIVGLQARELRAVELIPRWNNPHRGCVPGMVFSPLAEEMGVIDSIARPLLAQACEQAVAWGEVCRGDRPLSLAVNMTARELASDDLIPYLTNVLTASGLHPHNLIVEVNELVLVLHLDQVIGPLEGLRELGVRLAVDEFGTANMSLHELGRLPFDMLKLGRSLIDGIGHGVEEGELVRNVVELALAYDLQLIAQGVERARQAAELDGMGCRLGQGYYFSQPLDLNGMTALMHRARAGYGRLGPVRGQDLRLGG
jgi:diguanylate cyclase (GGDEF)-like protein